ncbi:hypothetical protein H4S14_000788 [Agrobacterium vitis]|nr:hypothetical protein [Agrobacterium vitis]MBE1437061.1 hypothetical protein [Agrobacterium vitis]
MSAAILLYVVTDDAKRSCRGLFGFPLSCAVHEAPWVSIIDDCLLLAAIPTGAAVISLWHGAGSPIEAMWREERLSRAFNDDYAVHVARIKDWLARRAAREAQLIAEYVAEKRDVVCAPVVTPPAPPETPKPLEVMWR